MFNSTSVVNELTAYAICIVIFPEDSSDRSYSKKACVYVFVRAAIIIWVVPKPFLLTCPVSRQEPKVNLSLWLVHGLGGELSQRLDVLGCCLATGVNLCISLLLKILPVLPMRKAQGILSLRSQKVSLFLSKLTFLFVKIVVKMLFKISAAAFVIQDLCTFCLEERV